jgi:tetratricopeptide (TPR) repeat protein
MAKSSKKNAQPPEPVSKSPPLTGDSLRPKPKALDWNRMFQVLLIVAAGFWIYWPVLHGDWLMDDVNYITQNPLLRDTAGLWKIWFEPGSFIEYYPLKASVEWIEWNLFGDDTLGYHLTNVVLHVVNALLVWRLLAKFGLQLAWLGGLIFAIHPAMIESVAWISELKNTLSLLPFLLAMGAWIDYEERKRQRDYWLALGLFLVAMLCKISMAPFPVVILLHAWWKRGRVGWSDLKASAPFFVISLTLGMASISIGSWFQQHYMPTLDAVPMGGFFSRLACAGLVLSQYLLNSLWPVNLMPIYPRWRVDPPSLPQFFPWVILGGIFYWLWRKRRSWGRHGLLGLGFFVLNLMPFLGFRTISYMGFTWVMDHFLYLPILGLIGLAVAGIEWIYGRLAPVLRPFEIAIIGVAMTLLAFESNGYAKAFINAETLSTYALKHNPGAWTAYNDLGCALKRSGRFNEAIDQFREALRIKPDYIESRYNLGNALFSAGRYPEAIEQYEQVLKVQSNYPKAHNNMAVTLAKMGHLPEAIEQFHAELQLYPDNTDARDNLAKVENLQKMVPVKH